MFKVDYNKLKTHDLTAIIKGEITEEVNQNYLHLSIKYTRVSKDILRD